MTKAKLKEFEFAPGVFKIFKEGVQLIGFVLKNKNIDKYKAYSIDGKIVGTKFVSKESAIEKLKSL